MWSASTAFTGCYGVYKPSDIRDVITLDFESERIEGRPSFPPLPVGLAVRYPDDEVEYLAWGHPTGNNCGLREARALLLDIWKSPAPVLFHGGKFDLAIAYEIFDLPELPWDRVHDTQFLAFLADPHARHIDLKGLAEDLLDWPADEQESVGDYVWKHRRRLVAKYGSKITGAKKGPYSAGAWISKCPGGVIEPYAIGDVDRTKELFVHLYPLIRDYGMIEAYERERQVLPIFMRNERDGMLTDVEGLRRDIPLCEESLEKVEDEIRDILDTPDLNINADQQLATALTESGIIDDDDWIYTKPTKAHPEGQKSVSKENLLLEMFDGHEVGRMLFYRNRMTTALSMFMKPWLKQAEQMDGYITTNWNQTMGEGGGTRTGRPSTNNHNFLNIAKAFDDDHDYPQDNEYGFHPLPLTRRYILPDVDEVIIHRDFDGQEMRVFAHYENGPLLAAYQENPKLDPHEWVGSKITRLTGKVLERTPVKTLNFLGLYGGGAPAAAKKLNCSLAEAKEFKAFHDKALPGRQLLNDAIREILMEGDPIRTWGGRVYFAPPPAIIKGRMQSFWYKMINYLCQGSAADITKEALIRWDGDDRATARFMVTVYDEINASTPEALRRHQMRILKEHMESIALDLAMTSSGKHGPNWGDLEKCS